MDTGDRLVVAQALALLGVGWPGRPRWRASRPVTAVALAVTAAGAGLAAAGAVPHGGLLTPAVTPPRDATLLTTGPYALRRNPIYAGLLVASAGVATLRRRPEPLLAWAALLVVLTAKVRLEEVRLTERFGADYRAYARRAPRFVGPVHAVDPEHGSGRRP